MGDREKLPFPILPTFCLATQDPEPLPSLTDSPQDPGHLLQSQPLEAYCFLLFFLGL